MSRPDQCPKCGSLEYTARNADGTRYDPWLAREDQMRMYGTPLWSSNQCDDCGHVYTFTFIEVAA
jgi:hypothetical protein